MHKGNEEQKKQYIEGLIRLTAKGVGYVDMPENADESVLIEPENINMALHRDTVRVLLLPKTKGENQAGEVAEILFRHKMKFVGTIEKEEAKSGKLNAVGVARAAGSPNASEEAYRGRTYLVPDDQKMYTDIMLGGEDAQKAKAGEKAYVEITKWTTR